ncbi:MAG: hypothetical protein WCS15_04535 [Prevotella sp.]
MNIDIKEVPTNILFESARREVLESISNAKKNYALPAELVKGILYQALYETEEQLKAEQAGSYGKLIDGLNKEEGKNAKDNNDNT